MDDYEYEQLLSSLNAKLDNIKSILNPTKTTQRLKELEALELQEDFWSDAKKAKEVASEKNLALSKLAKFNNANNALNDAKELYEMAKEENDTSTINSLFEEANSLKQLLEDTELEMMLSEKDDSKNAIVSIHPGAGGTESCDWADMLYRMYLRYSDKKGFKAKVIDYQVGDEAGIKDVTLLISGLNAYGYLKNESGIHRLVRISPFDSNAKRHTSFASVLVSPEVDDDIDIVIEPKDIRIDTYRSSGAGGQHVNKTESAIRITHIPTNIVVQCQNDRSQHKNKAYAIKMLKSRLYEFERAKAKQEQNDSCDKSEIGWGHQIRSYVLQPYRQIKDMRTNIAYSNVDAILDGDLDKIISDLLVFENKND